ncbi:MAG: LysM peptidoglycan-binding domain-containing protein [Candidatus Omnitrophica bacterium]|nr:LysM peptidoglycan-binding domain-containing protein [Candidatus Omnitrophota bacterium]
MPKAKPQKKTADEEIWGNRGYITKTEPPQERSTIKAVVVVPATEKYTVGKNDTLQKISNRFYGTTKKWLKIYEANKAVLKGPDKIYPGQVLSIPIDSKTSARKTEALEETGENLK